jgi:signal peptidase I
VKKREKSAAGSLVELVVIVAIALGLALGIPAFLVKPYRIPSESMVPTLEVGQRVLVNRIGNRFSDPSVGEIVVFHPPVGAETQTCGAARRPSGQACDQETPQKSIVGGHVILNGKRQKDGFTRPCADGDGCDFPTPITIPPGHYFMMGDNRGESDDSRFWGPVPKKWIIGGAFATYWPPNRIGLF